MFVLKNEADDSKRHKTRLVVKGYGQEHGVDFNEIFSLVVKHSSIRVILSLVVNLDLKLVNLMLRRISYMVTWMRKFICHNQKVLLINQISILCVD
jgi:Reverse transcriptase (RNA-dependent DNA polymerase)